MIESAQGILTLEEVASYLRVTNRTMYRFTQEGAVSAFKLGGTWQFWRDELNQGILAIGKPLRQNLEWLLPLARRLRRRQQSA
jgi:excisionase family DNA binding protein